MWSRGKRAWEMLSPLPGTSYVAMLLTCSLTPTASLTQVPQEQVTASALRQEEPLKKENKTSKNQRKLPSSTRIRNQKLRLANSLSRDQQARLSPPVLEITVDLTNICLFACLLSFQRCFQAFLRRSRNQECFPLGISAFVSRTAFPGMKARETKLQLLQDLEEQSHKHCQQQPFQGTALPDMQTITSVLSYCF